MTVNLTVRRGSKGQELTESDVPRMIPAHGEIPHHTPQVINSDVPPSTLRFAIPIQTPNLLHLAAKLFSEDLPEPISVIAKSSGEDDKIRVERAVVFES